MAAELKPYRAYKDSGVEWLGAVPAHWDVRHLGRFGRLFKGGGGTKEDERESGVPCVRYGDLYTQHQFFITATRACVTPELAKTVYSAIRYGDVLFAGSGETIDEIGKSAVNLIHDPACCGGDVIILRPSIDADARFLGYVMDCAATARQKACIGRGFTVVHIYSSDLKYVTVAMPSLPEQAAIVRFLAHADRRIRRYICAKQKLIALLEEHEHAIIHQAVTGRIDVRTGRPYPVYKDARLDWSPRLPEHWDDVTLGIGTESIQTGPFGSQLHAGDYVSGEIPVINPSHLIRGTIHPDLSVTISRAKATELSRHALQVHDIVMARRGEVGRCALVTESESGWLCGTGSIRIRPRLGAFAPVYLAQLLSASLVKRVLDGASIGATMDNLNPGIVTRLRLPQPPLSQQVAIAGYLSRITVALGKARETVRRQILALECYRARLVVDVVTGKLDVRAVSGLPDVDPSGADGDLDDDPARHPDSVVGGPADDPGLVPTVVDEERSVPAAAAADLTDDG